MTSSDPPDRRKNDLPAWARASEERRAPFKPKNIPSPSETRANAYARFIPREELGGFAAWKPSDLAGGPPPQANVHRAPDEVPDGVEQAVVAQAQAAQAAAAQHALELRTARQSGYQDGYRDGLVALEGFKQSFAAQTTSQVGTLLHSMGSELDAVQHEMASTLTITATQLARQIVRSELATRPALVAQVAQEALDTLLLSARHITLRVHPDDQAFVAQGAAEVLAARGARLLADATMARGGCVVESDIGVIDASLETRWRRAAASLGCDVGWAGDVAVAAAPSVAPTPEAAPAAPTAFAASAEPVEPPASSTE
jgi:flagellar assembly protein FliH